MFKIMFGIVSFCLYVFGGSYLEHTMGVTSPAFYAFFGYVFGTINYAVFTYRKIN